MSTRPEPLIGALLRVPLRATMRVVEASVREAGFADVHPTHLPVFQYPGPDGVSPSDLAARLGMTKQALNHLLGHLEARRYLRRAVGRDGRSRVIRLLARGRALLEAIREATRQVERRYAELLGERPFRTLRELLVLLSLRLQEAGGAKRSGAARKTRGPTDVRR